jgi:heat shock protein HslJ
MCPLVRIAVGILATIGLTAVAVCAGPLTAGELMGTWELVEVHSLPLPTTGANARPVFTITDQSIEGFDGCNNFSGRLDKPGSIASTRRGCVEGTVKLPLDLTDPMSHLKSGRIHNGTLILPAREGIAESVFRRVKVTPKHRVSRPLKAWSSADGP